MKNKKLDAFEELVKANPIDRSDIANSDATSERRMLWERIQAGQNSAAKAQYARRGPRRLVWVGIGLAAVLVAALVPLLVAYPGIRQATTNRSATTTVTLSQTQTTYGVMATTTTPLSTTITSSTASLAPGTVTHSVALVDIIQLIKKLNIASVPAFEGEDVTNRLLDQARELGIILSGDVTTDGLATGTTRAQFALWLWRAFGSHLAERTTAKFKDLSSLRPEEGHAILALAEAGVVEGANGYFRGSDGLSQQAEKSLLARISQLVSSRSLGSNQ